MHEQELRQHRCCFTGHRPEKLNISEEQLCVRLGLEIDRAIEDGFYYIYFRDAKGVDICAAELVLKRRVSDDRLKLICALPYENFGLHWSASWTSRYVEVIRHADLVRCISQEFSYSAYQRRNEWMVDHSGRVIAAYTGESGGTRNYHRLCQTTAHSVCYHHTVNRGSEPRRIHLLTPLRCNSQSSRY